MAKYFGIARDATGNTIGSAQVSVFLAGTSTPASIYSNSGLSTPLANPFTSNADGTYSFFIAGGTYKVQVTKTGFTGLTVDDLSIGIGSHAHAAGDITSGTLSVGRGGTGAATLAAHGVVIGNGTGAVAVSGAGTTGQVLTSNGASADPTFQTPAGGAPSGSAGGDLGSTYPNPTVVATHLASPLPVAQGGTGAGTLAAHGVVVGNGTSAAAVTGTGNAGEVLTSNGASADPTFQPLPLPLRKPSSQTFTAVAPDDDLQFTVNATGVYEVDIFAAVEGDSTNGFYGEIAGGTASIGSSFDKWVVYGLNLGVPVGITYGIGNVSATGFDVATVECRAILAVTGTGTIKVSFGTATAAGTVDVLINSIMEMRKIN